MRISLRFIRAGFAIIFLMAGIAVQGTTIIGPWVPKFKGVDYSVSTNLPSGGDFPNLHVVHALRVDLTDPDIRLHSTPRISDYVANAREVGGRTISDYLKGHYLQAAINANFFGPGDYYLPAGTPMDVYGLAVSEGVVVSPQDGPTFASTIVFDASNRATAIHTNWPATSVDGVFTAVTGEYSLVVDGKNVAYDLPTGGFIHRANPRTAFGVSQDRQFLYLVTIDGRQPGYSEGAYDYETAGWLLLLGAYDGMNVDGGGSTTLVIEDSTGVPVRLNRSSAVADSGRERTVGSHFGVFAKPVPGFINDVAALPDDTTARITWTTVEPATSEVQYGPATDFRRSSGVQSALVSNHVVELSGLTPNTGYYYRLISSTESQQFVSFNFFFVTTNYVTTNHIFGVTNSWRYTTANLDGVDWASSSYDDSTWSGPGPGLLWVDVSARGPNPMIESKSTEMPANPSNNGFPFVTYYFRTDFMLANLLQGSSLRFSGYIDDGAVFYLNGSEIQRVRMPGSPNNETLASGFPCDGDATCLEEFTIPVYSINNPVLGDNVLAVEVHNYNTRSGDITFGMALDLIEPARRPPRLEIRSSGEGVTLSWEADEFVLQSAHASDGPWNDVPGVVASPFVTAPLRERQYFRLRK